MTLNECFFLDIFVLCHAVLWQYSMTEWSATYVCAVINESWEIKITIKHMNTQQGYLPTCFLSDSNKQF